LKNDSFVFHPLRALSNAAGSGAALNHPQRLAGRAEGPPGGALHRIARFAVNVSQRNAANLAASAEAR
jgi:hypothetical protein